MDADSEFFVRRTADIAMVLYAARWAVQWWPTPRLWPAATSPLQQRDKVAADACDGAVLAIWSLGCVAMWVHVAVAFHCAHNWSHAAAFEHTANRTRELLGTAYGAGVWFNYAFLAIWTVDAVVCWFAPNRQSIVAADHLSSKRFAGVRASWFLAAVQRLAHAYMAFIAINSTIVFETGAVRIIGTVVLVGLGLLWLIHTISRR